jgi:hypothetical protein
MTPQTPDTPQMPLPAAEPVAPRPKRTKAAAAKPGASAVQAAKPLAKKAARSATPAAKTAHEPAKKAARKRPTEPQPTPRAVLVRDSFTMPQAEYAVLAVLKQRLLKLGHEAKKSELLRASLARLAALDDDALLQAAQSVTRLATGRPKHKVKAKGKH